MCPRLKSSSSTAKMYLLQALARHPSWLWLRPWATPSSVLQEYGCARCRCWPQIFLMVQERFLRAVRYTIRLGSQSLKTTSRLVCPNLSMTSAPASSPSPRRSPKKRKRILLVILLLIVLGGFALRHPVSTHLRAMSVLLRLADAKATGVGVRFARHPVQEQLGTAVTPAGPLRYRLYIPQDVENPPGMVLLHGVHHLGIEEPRLVNFAHALAGTGIEVMTPELKDLADYHVSPPTVDQIGISAVILSNQLHQPRVCILGLSFAGGLALLTAARPEYS